MKIKFNSDDNLSLNKPLNFHNMTITIKSVFKEDGKLYPQVFLDDTLNELNIQKCQNTKELKFQKGLILIKQTYQRNVIFVTISILDHLIQKAMSFNNIAIVYVKGNTYRINFWYMNKNDAINIMNGSILLDKRGAL